MITQSNFLKLLLDIESRENSLVSHKMIMPFVLEV